MICSNANDTVTIHKLHALKHILSCITRNFVHCIALLEYFIVQYVRIHMIILCQIYVYIENAKISCS